MKTPQELLHQALEAGECLLPDAPPGGRSAHPTVFVHGLLGWGAQDALYRAVPYWGLAAGDVLGYLNRCGYDCRAASATCTSSGQPCASSCMSSRAVAPPKLCPTRSTGLSAPQPGTSGAGYAVPKRA